MDQGGGTYVGYVPMLSEGATAYLVELTYNSSIPGFPHVFTTEVRVKSTLPLFDWPFDTGSPVPAAAAMQTVEVASAAATATAPAGTDDPSRNAAASALVIGGDLADPLVEAWAPGLLPPAVEELESSAVTRAVDGLMLAEEPATGETDDAETDAELVDYVFGSTLSDLLA